MSSYVFPARQENFVLYVGRLSFCYAAVAVAAGFVAAFLVLGIVHPIFTVLTLAGVGLSLVAGQNQQRNMAKRSGLEISGRDQEIAHLQLKYRELSDMYAARQQMIALLTEENRQLKEDLEALHFKKKSA